MGKTPTKSQSSQRITESWLNMENDSVIRFTPVTAADTRCGSITSLILTIPIGVLKLCGWAYKHLLSISSPRKGRVVV
jgi:hypothetical protein